MDKVKNWLKQPLTKKQVKAVAFFLGFCVGFNLIATIMFFATSQIILGILYILFTLFTSATLALYVYGLKNFYKEDK